jgi:hypothetical protein
MKTRTDHTNKKETPSMNFEEAVAAVLQNKIAARQAWIDRGDDDLCIRIHRYPDAQGPGGIVDICGWTQAGTRATLTDEDRQATDWLILRDEP